MSNSNSKGLDYEGFLPSLLRSNVIEAEMEGKQTRLYMSLNKLSRMLMVTLLIINKESCTLSRDQGVAEEMKQA